MNENYAERRKRLDHERYLRHREERLKAWHEYYDGNREEILAKKRLSGYLKYGSCRRRK